MPSFHEQSERPWRTACDERRFRWVDCRDRQSERRETAGKRPRAASNVEYRSGVAFIDELHVVVEVTSVVIEVVVHRSKPTISELSVRHDASVERRFGMRSTTHEMQRRASAQQVSNDGTVRRSRRTDVPAVTSALDVRGFGLIAARTFNGTAT